MAARSRARSGRLRVAIGLAAFIVVTAIVVFRRSEGTRVARQMRTMESELRELRSRKLAIKTQLRGATSRATVIREAERRLGMHVASEVQTRSLPEAGAR
ncbi:MAG: hypothetical protein K2R93_05015 [Gemmatimonadaceae bacterium]|nr:hypothetical protein [Gemmatimonadaceae bacterium]